MGQIRRKLDNYTVVLLHAEGTGKNLNLIDMAALRVREGKEAGSVYFACGAEADRPLEEIVRDFRDFIGNDAVLTDDMDSVLPLLEELYRRMGDTFFTNTIIDAVPLFREACRQEAHPGDLEQRRQWFREEPDMEKKLRLLKNIYDEITDILFSYQREFPYWICGLTAEDERYMAGRLAPRKRSLLKTYLFWCIGCHYFYLGKPRRNAAYLLTLGGLGIWAILDLYRIPYLVDNANAVLADEVYRQYITERQSSLRDLETAGGQEDGEALPEEPDRMHRED